MQRLGLALFFLTRYHYVAPYFREIIHKNAKDYMTLASAFAMDDEWNDDEDDMDMDAEDEDMDEDDDSDDDEDSENW